MRVVATAHARTRTHAHARTHARTHTHTHTHTGIGNLPEFHIRYPTAHTLVFRSPIHPDRDVGFTIKPHGTVEIHVKSVSPGFQNLKLAGMNNITELQCILLRLFLFLLLLLIHNRAVVWPISTCILIPPSCIFMRKIWTFLLSTNDVCVLGGGCRSTFSGC